MHPIWAGIIRCGHRSFTTHVSTPEANHGKFQKTDLPSSNASCSPRYQVGAVGITPAAHGYSGLVQLFGRRDFDEHPPVTATWPDYGPGHAAKAAHCRDAPALEAIDTGMPPSQLSDTAGRPK